MKKGRFSIREVPLFESKSTASHIEKHRFFLEEAQNI